MKFDEPIPVTILTGFLGAGKSTLLNELLASDAFADTAVIINEFGDISIDHDLVHVNQRELMVTTTGCLCCTASSDIRTALFELYDALDSNAVPPFKRVIVETTGLADPAPIINQITMGSVPGAGYRAQVVAGHFQLSGVVCAVDVTMAHGTLERHFECMKQVAFADLIVLTKTDINTEPRANARPSDLLQMLSQINPAAAIVDRHGTEFDLASVFVPRRYVPSELGSDVEGWLALEQALADDSPSHDNVMDANRHSAAGIQSVALVENRLVSARNLASFVDLLNTVAGPQMLRLKGLIGLEDDPERPLVIHGVQHVIYQYRLPAWPSDDRRTRIVVITHNLDGSVVKSLFTAITGISARAKARMVATVLGLSALGAALVAVLLHTFHDGAVAHLEFNSAPAIPTSTGTTH
ncbi:GTP-binding protein [Bradyrhizobium sp. ARR65]|uniref:CobW family GTP-binding protein n=1 Tax=Bradyrhizobium sp. ARR65 TaxID=1040989 RepID=UPI000464F9F3|nr:GTP-binding protein [Bradyrhizobium sp. ARR65]